jgi:uncharacterized protein (DUF1501 family)
MLLSTMAAAGVVSGLNTSVAFASVPGDKRFVFVLLRGALDGLAAVPAYGDPDYVSLRGGLALSKTGPNPLLDLDGHFGLHPALVNLKAYYDAKQLTVFHNICSPYRNRSHFDGQNVLETGATAPNRLHDGWLNRALVAMGGKPGALAVAPTPPLVLIGKVRATSWMPDTLPEPDESYFARVASLYAGDKVLGPSLESAMSLRAQAKSAMDDPASKNKPKIDLIPLFQGAGRLLAMEEGPRVAVLDPSGWDTHNNEGAGDGQLARRLSALDSALDAMKQALGPAWSKTVIVVATEFGRTVKVNGTGGTDHGTGSAAFLLGGAVSGGHTEAEWVGLKPAALQDGRDLPPRADLRALFKSVLSEHMHVPHAALDAKVFPDSGQAKAFRGLIA